MLLNKKLAIRFLVIIFSLLLVSCGGDKSSITTGSGASGVTSDGGSGSASFAGTYTGTISVTIKGDEISEVLDDPFTVIVRSDGTASLTISGETIEGVIDGNRIGFSIRYDAERDLLECSVEAIITATITGSSISGVVSGGGSCKLIAIKTGVSLTGTLSGSKS